MHTPVFAAFLLSAIIELCLWLPSIWQRRHWLAPFSGGITVIATLAGALALPIGWFALLAIIGVYRIVNIRRVIKGRTQADYLYEVARRASLWLLAFQVLVLVAPQLLSRYGSLGYGWYGAAIVQFGVALVLVASTLRHLRTTKPAVVANHYADRDLPTVTVAIPARNETDDLVACLQSILASTYPKLEIIVLDDCSQNSRTPELIRSFAHDGVRFMAGKVPPENWLAKNYAYQQLSEVANGDVLLFCGVDTRFEPETITALVEDMLFKNKTMLSVMPANRPPANAFLMPLFTQPNRYAWELCLPRRWLRRPPVLSTCWLINANMLKDAGGFKAIAHGAVPERHFADFAATHDDGYSFMVSDHNIGLASLKTFQEQRSTAIRTRYPQLHRRIDLVCLLSLVEAFSLLGPFVVLVRAGLVGDIPTFAVSIVSCVLLVGLYISIVKLTYRRLLVRSLFVMPLSALFDLFILNLSMYRYEFGDVYWKDRNVCLPIMRVIPSLPKLK